jgi:hypothetical protein
MREICLLRQLDKRHCIRFVDIAVEWFDTASVSVSWEKLVDQLHGRLRMAQSSSGSRFSPA